jgi:O-antigen/teichoic acid export membrane protein
MRPNVPQNDPVDVAVHVPETAALPRHVALSTAANYAGQIVNLGVWFFLTPFILHHLGRDQYGLWVLVASFVAYGTLADMGVGAALVKYVAEYRARGESEIASQLIATSLWLYCAAGLLVVAVGAAIAPVVPDLLAGVRRADRPTVSWLVALVALGVAVQLPATAAASILRGLHRWDLVNLVRSLAILTLAGCTAAILLLGGKVISITAVVIPLTLLFQVVSVYLIRRVAPDLHFGFRGASRSMVRQVTAFSSALFGIQVAQAVKLNTDEIVIGAGISVSAIAPYNFGRRLSAIPALLTFQFVQVLLPTASRLHAEGEEWLLREIYLTGIRLTIALFAAIGGALIVFAGPFLAAWVGPQYAASADIAVLLLVAAFLEALMSLPSQLLQGMNRHRPLVAFALGSAALNLGLSIALIEPLGVRGVAAGTLIATSVEALIALPFSARVIGVRPRQVLRQVVVPGLLPLVPMVAVLVALRDTLAPSTIVTIILSGLAGAITYAACYLVHPATTRERAVLRRIAAVALAPFAG